MPASIARPISAAMAISCGRSSLEPASRLGRSGRRIDIDLGCVIIDFAGWLPDAKK
jgi:hypothetical protein